MTHRSRRLLAGVALAAVCASVTACGSDDTDGTASQNEGSSQNDTSSQDDASSQDAGASADAGEQDPGDAYAEATEAIGEEGMLEITGEQLVGKFGVTAFAIEDGRLILDNEGSADQAELTCLSVGLVIEGVGATSPYSIRFGDDTINCEDFK